MNINLTENSFAYQSAKRLLEKELDKCFKLLKKTEEKWNSFMDLKLHDASYGVDLSFELNGANVSFDNYSEWFTDFCEISYDNLIEDCRQLYNTDFDELREEVGRTSSFYLGSLHNNADCHYIVALAEASCTFTSSDIEFKEDEKGIHIVEDDRSDIEDFVNSMLELVEDMYEELEEKITEITNVYDYIYSFKENQVENFKEFVKDNWMASLEA